MIPNIKLNNGIEMPVFGLGTWHMSDVEAEHAVRTALDIGYRLIDTAKLYGNERGVGKAIRESDIKREEIFLTTKLWPIDFFSPQNAFDESLSKLDIGYIDLYLVHWPIPLMTKSIWRVMEKIYDSKKTRAIGISNYGIGDIEKLLGYARIPPAVNQIRFSTFDYEAEILACCTSHGIVVEAYSPLSQGSNLDDATISSIAKRYGKSPAQIMIRWCIEHGTVAIPKSSNPERMRENMEVFDFTLAAEDMQTLDALS